MAKKRIACILVRVSRPTQNLQSQIDDLLKIAEDKGYSVPKQFIFGEKITGMNAGFKKSLNELLLALDNKKNHIEACFIWEITRLSRGAYDFVGELMQINSRNVPVYFYDMNLWTWDFEHNCLSKENCDKLIGASIYGRTEWEKISRRTKRGRDAIAKQGYYIGHVADGYIPVKAKDGKHKEIAIDEERRGVIETIFRLFVEGSSTDEIAQILNSEGIPTTTKYRCASPFFNYKKTYKKAGRSDIEFNREDAKWQGSQISQIISCRWYIGERSYDGELFEIEPIISKEVFSKAETIRSARAVRFRTDRKSKIHNYLLGGLIFCGKCGRKMYGHTTGLNNHYFCSSVEEGKKCGLHGVCKENIEAIVCQMVKDRAIGKLMNNEHDVTSDFFRLNADEIEVIKRKIKVSQQMIKSAENEIHNLESRKFEFYSMLADGKDKETIEQLLARDEKQHIEQERIIQEQQIAIDMNRKRLNAGKNIGKIIDDIVVLNDNNTFQQLIESTVRRIEVHNVDNSISIIRIEYLNGKDDLCIYSYRLLKNNYVAIQFIAPSIVPIHIDIPTKSIIIDKGSIAFDNGGICMLSDEEEIKEEDKEEINSMTWYRGQMTIRDFIINCRNNRFCLVPFDRTVFEEDDDRKAAQSKKYKEWRKKYNNNLPTCVPYVVRDGNYEEYLKQRKHLYNRRYKIKNNKRLTVEEKRERLSLIDEALSILRAKIKYLSRAEAVKQHLDNQL